MGNRTSVTQSGVATTYSVNNLNEYTQVGATTPTSDANGNVAGPVDGFACTYDAQSRLVSMSKTSGGQQSGSTTTCTFAYDARNRCVGRTVSTRSGKHVTVDSSTYVYDGWNLVAEFGAEGEQDASYVQGAAVDELLVMNSSENGAMYHQQDGLGSTGALTNTGGQVVERYSYDVFGSPICKNAAGSVIASSGYGNRFLFTGREWLADVGLYDYRNRVYAPGLGRFGSVDPVRFKLIDACLNMYEYVCNDPVRFTDPTGLWKLCPGVNNSKLNTVTCQGGKPTPSLRNLGPHPSDKVTECAKKHEQSHIDDINAENPGICQGVPDGTTVCASNDQQGDDSECKAWRIELDCETHCTDPAARGRANHYRQIRNR